VAAQSSTWDEDPQGVSLLLATGHLGGEVAGKVCDPDCVQHVHRLLAPLNSRFIQRFERCRHILQGGEGGQ